MFGVFYKKNVMKLDGVMQQLSSMGSEQSKKVLVKHGAREPFFGVKVADLKKLISKLKKDIKVNKADYPNGLHGLAMELYQTGNSDAMYMAGLMVDAKQMTKAEIQDWVDKAYWYYISDFTVAGTAAESNFGWELGHEWIDSDSQFVASAGWATLGAIASITPDEELDLEAYTELIQRAQNEIHGSINRVRYSMNGFVIATGSYFPALTDVAKFAGKEIGLVEVDMGGTSCKVPVVVDYIKKVEDRGSLGKKRKRAFC